MIDVWAEFLELWLHISVDYVFDISAVVEVLVLVYVDITLSGDRLPDIFVCLRKLRLRLCIRNDDLLHGARGATSDNNEDNGQDEEAN